MNFSVVCMAFLLLVGSVQMESTNCPKELKQELEDVTNACFPNAKEKFRAGTTLSPEEKSEGFQCVAQQIPSKPHIQSLVSGCAVPADSTEQELETYMTCVKTHLSPTGCFPNHDN